MSYFETRLDYLEDDENLFYDDDEKSEEENEQVYEPTLDEIRKNEEQKKQSDILASREKLQDLNLEGKLNWIKFKTEEIPFVLESFMDFSKKKINNLTNTHKSQSRKKFETFKNHNIPVYYSTHSGINFKEKKSDPEIKQSVDKNSTQVKQHVRQNICRHFLNNGVCKFGSNCMFSHNIPLVEKVNQNNQFKEAENNETKLREVHENMKHILCKNNAKIVSNKIIITNNCKFKNCKFAHSCQEIENTHIPKCKYNTQCKYIIFKNGKYTNNGRCNRLHENESVVDFIIRTQN